MIFLQWRIQEFPDEGRQPRRLGRLLFLQKNCRNCMKMKEIGLGDVPNTKVKET